MSEILDCTFRDGGYYNDWDFDDEIIDSYLDAVSRLPIKAVEIGYCNHPKSGYFGKFFFLKKEDLLPIRARLRPDQDLVIMLNAKDCDPKRIPELVGELVGVVDMVRMAVAPADLAHGAALARALHNLGFRVGFNVMYLSTYWDRLSALETLVDSQDVIESAALVDSYGSCTPEQTATAMRSARKLLNRIQVGFHGHDNLGLAFANTLAAIGAGAEIVDSTFLGMGRGAGNLKTELMLVNQAARSGDVIDYEALSEVVQSFELLQKEYGWGTNLPYMISGAANLPQRDVMDWLGKNRYSVVSVLRALHSEKSGGVDVSRYPDLSPTAIDTNEADDILIVGGGDSFVRHLDAITRLVARDGMPVIHASFRHIDRSGDLGKKQLICLAGHGATRLPSTMGGMRVRGFLVAAPPRFEGTIPSKLPADVLQVAPFSEKTDVKLGPISDTGPLSLALGAAVALSVKRISLVGFDGYRNATKPQQELAREVQDLLDAFRSQNANIQVNSLTPTLYEVPQESIYSELV